jgi:tripartite-type tricarboxylate transporter receptor subunit TctC
MRALPRRTLLAAPALLAAALPAAAQQAASAWPTRPVRLVVPFPAGGGTDIHARIVARKLSEMLGQPFVVDNRGGANGQIGYDHVAKAAPDGYTLVMGTGGLTILPSLYPRMTFDPMADLLPISTVVRIQNVMILHPSIPATTLAEFIAYARANPGKVDYATTGPGNPPHLAAALLISMTGIEMNHVPFIGDTPALTNLIGGHVQMFISPMAGAMPHIREGRVRPIAVSARRRAVALPEIPTVEEAGLPGYDVASWCGVLGPARLPRPIAERLNAALVEIVAMPDVRADFIAAGSDPASTTMEEFQALMRENFTNFARIIEASGARRQD